MLEFHLILIGLFLWCLFLDVTWRFWKRRGGLSSIPSLKNMPWLGSVPYFTTCPHENYKRRILNGQKFNGLFMFWFGPIPCIMLGCVEYIEAVLRTRETITKSLFYDYVEEWLGRGLLLSTGSKWKKRRVQLTAAFHFAVLNDFVDIHAKHARRLVEKLLGSIEKKAEVQKLFSEVMLDVICETSMGVEISAAFSSSAEYVEAVEKIKALLLSKASSPISGSRWIYPWTRDGKEYYRCLNILHSFTNDVINKNIAKRKTEVEVSGSPEVPSGMVHGTEVYMKQRRVLIDILLDLYDQGEIDVEGIREEVDTFMFEGHDTTSSALSWLVYEIGRHPDIQEQLHEEIVLASNQSASLMDTVRMLNFMECVIKETMRLHPPVPAYSRRLENSLVINGVVIPSGTILVVDTINVHMNPEYWDDPHVFNPMRFDRDESVQRNPYCFVPFSAGPRNCIGQKFALLEEKVFLYFLLSAFEVKSLQQPDEIKTGIELITSSTNGIHIQFFPRK